MQEIKHGTGHAYRVRMCRCDLCTEANTEGGRRERERRKAMAKEDPASVPHGKSGYANFGCRCEICVQAKSLQNLDQRSPERQASPKGRTQDGHGSSGGYERRKCRCDRCLSWRDQQLQTSPHGSVDTYRWGCRCETCVNARGQRRPKQHKKKHGIPWGFKRGCRCQPCVVVHQSFLESCRLEYHKNKPNK